MNEDKFIDELFFNDNEPIIEELTEEDIYKSMIIKSIIVLKKNMKLIKCRDCGYKRQIWNNQKHCPNFKCKSTNLEIIDVDELNKKINDKNEKLYLSLKKKLGFNMKG